MKKIVALLLAAALCAGLLAGCGEKQESQPTAETARPEEVYISAFTPLQLPEGAEGEAWAIDGDVFYTAVYEKLADGEIPEGKTPDYEGQYDVMGYRIYRLEADGSARPLAYTPLPAPEDSQGRQDYSADSYVERIFPADDGGLLVIERQGESWYTGEAGQSPENYDDYWSHVESRYGYFLRRLDAEGHELESRALPMGSEEGYQDMRNAVLDGDGNLYLVADQGSGQSIYVYSGAGERIAEIPTGGWVYDTVRLKDGRAAVMLWDNDLQLLAVDPKGQHLEKLVSMDIYAQTLGDGGGDYDFYYINGTRLYGYRLEDQEATVVLDWLDCDLSARDLRAMQIGADGTIRAVSRSEGEPAALATLRKVPRDAAVERQVLTLGTLYADSVSEAVLRFNRSQDRVRIQLRDYSDYVNGEDYEAGLTKLTTEIMAGDMPDLLSLDSLPYAQLAARGLLEDLYPWIDADPDLQRTDFFENVLHSMEVGGGLFEAAPGFSIITVMGPSDIVGDTPGWTYEDFYAAMAKMPEGATAFGPEVGRDNILEMCSYLSMNRFVDWGTGACDFEQEEFAQLLEFCRQFPALEQMAYDEDGSDMSRIAEGQQLLVFASLFSMDEAVYNDQYFKGASTYIGFPTAEGVGNILYPGSGYAMSASSTDKEAAWRFLREFLTEDYQTKYGEHDGLGLPLNRAAFQKAMDKAMEVEYQKDSQGRYVLDANGEKIPVSKGGMGLSVGGGAVMEFELWAMSEEQAEKLLQVIETADRSADLNTTVAGIIREEAQAYFAGQKSAGEVARLVQSKVKLYVSEQY